MGLMFHCSPYSLSVNSKQPQFLDSGWVGVFYSARGRNRGEDFTQRPRRPRRFGGRKRADGWRDLNGRERRGLADLIVRGGWVWRVHGFSFVSACRQVVFRFMGEFDLLYMSKIRYIMDKYCQEQGEEERDQQEQTVITERGNLRWYWR